MEKPTVIDLFCCAGQFSEGFRQAGFELTAGLDINKSSLETYHYNFPNAKILHYDITQVPVKILVDLKPKVVIGSPPCTEFSKGNINRTWDTSLIEKFLEIVEAINPDYYVMENVPDVQDSLNSLDGKFRGKFPTQLILNANHFGAATWRTRFFGGRFPRNVQKLPEKEWPSVKEVINVNRPGFKQPYKDSVYRKIDPDKPLFTICSQRIGNERYLLPNDTSLEVSELAVCQGLPPHFVFPCSRSEAQRQLGMGVCPPVAKAIGTVIINDMRLKNDT